MSSLVARTVVQLASIQCEVGDGWCSAVGHWKSSNPPPVPGSILSRFCCAQKVRRHLDDLPDVQTLWYAAFVRIMLRACTYTLLIAMFLQYDKICWCFILSNCIIVILSRTYEVFYPWLESIGSPRTFSAQLNKAMSEFDEEASRTALNSSKMPWPSDFPTVTYATLLEGLKLQMQSSGMFVSLSGRDYSTCTHLQPRHQGGWVNGSGLLVSAGMCSAASAFLAVAMANDSSLFWKATVGFLYVQCFLILAIVQLPAFTVSLNRAVKITDSNTDTHMWWNELHVCWLELASFARSLVMSGFPFICQTTVLGPSTSTLFWKILGHLEGIELATYVLFALVIIVSVELFFYGLVSFMKFAGVGQYLNFVCSNMKTLLMCWIPKVPFFPGLSRVGMELMNAESALAAQRTCQSGQCIKALRLDEVLAHLEEIVAAKGEIHSPCTFFATCRSADENLEALDEELRRRAIAVGLMNSAKKALESLRKASINEGTKALESLLRLLRVYTMDSTVPNPKTKELMLATADLVQNTINECTNFHWGRYKDRDMVEPNNCNCVSERDWLIIVAQLKVSLLLVYTGWRSSSLYWPYVHLEPTLRDWVSNRFTSSVGVAECSFVSAY